MGLPDAYRRFPCSIARWRGGCRGGYALGLQAKGKRNAGLQQSRSENYSPFLLGISRLTKLRTHESRAIGEDHVDYHRRTPWHEDRRTKLAQTDS